MPDQKTRRTPTAHDLLGDNISHALISIGTQVSYKKDQVIIEPDIATEYSYRIVSGLVGVYTLNKDCKNSFVIYGKDELFSIEWIVGRGRLGIYYEAVEDCVLERYSNNKLLDLLKHDSGVSFFVLKRIINQSMLYKARLDNLEYQYASQRLAYRLLLLGRRFGVKRKEGVLLPQLSNHRLARTINLTRESVNRELAKFAKLQLIVIEGNRIIIADEVGLRRQIVSNSQDLYLDNF